MTHNVLRRDCHVAFAPRNDMEKKDKGKKKDMGKKDKRKKKDMVKKKENGEEEK